MRLAPVQQQERLPIEGKKSAASWSLCDAYLMTMSMCFVLAFLWGLDEVENISRMLSQLSTPSVIRRDTMAVL